MVGLGAASVGEESLKSKTIYPRFRARSQQVEQDRV